MNMGEYPDAAERYMRLALKAQTQCRATIETLAQIKNPPMVFARQANVTSGPQQINNGVPLAREIQTEQGKLLEQTHGERVDPGATGETIGSDSSDGDRGSDRPVQEPLKAKPWWHAMPIRVGTARRFDRLLRFCEPWNKNKRCPLNRLPKSVVANAGHGNTNRTRRCASRNIQPR